MKKITTFLIWLAVLASGGYLLMTGWYNVPTLDDYGYIWQAEKNFWDSIALPYVGWQGRFSTYFMNGIVYLLFGRAANLIGVTVLMLVIGYWLAGRLLGSVLQKYGYQVPQLLLWGAAVLAINIGAMAYLEPSTFFWLCALNYTFSTWMTLLLVYALWFSKNPKWLRWLEVVLAALYISGTAENFTPLVIMVLGLIWLFGLIRDTKSDSFKQAFADRKMLFTALAILCIGFLVMLLAPGNAKRAAGLDNTNPEAVAQWTFAFSPFVKHTVVATLVLLIRLLSRSLYYIALLPVFVYMGYACKGKATEISGRKVLWAFAFVLGLIVVEVAACVYGTGYYAPPRANSFLSYVIVGVLAYMGVVWGSVIKNGKWIGAATMVSCVLITISCICFIVQDQPRLKLYHDEVKAWHDRVERQKEASGKEMLVVPAYTMEREQNTYTSLRNGARKLMGKSPKYNEVNVLLMPATLGTNPADWRNLGVQRYFGIDFDIVGENE